MMEISVIKKIKDNFQFEKYLAVFAIIDICLLPYIRPLRSTISMLLLLVWYAHKFLMSKPSLKSVINNLKQDKEAQAFVATCLLIGISLLVGVSSLPPTVPASYQGEDVNILSHTVTYSAIYIFVFLYYFFYREIVKKYHQLVYKTVKFVFFTFLIFALVYMVSPTLFYRIRTVWTLSGKVQTATVATSDYFRYTYSFSDPNNFAAIAVAVMILLLEDKNENKYLKILSVVGCLILLVSTMSVQGFLGMACYVGVKMVLFIARIVKKEILFEKRYIHLAIGMIVIVLVAIPFLLQIPLVEVAVNRVFNNFESFLIRLKIWIELLNGKGVLRYLLFGRGCAIVLGGKAVRPHNGHLYLLYAYGFLAYVLYMYVFFRKRKYLLWKDMYFLIPIFVCFSINVGLIDSRYSFFMAMIIAYGLRELGNTSKKVLINNQ